MSDVSETLGQRLKAERERKGLSAHKAADELHLDAWVIDALESGDYARIGPPVYAKGHLKRYAGLLGLPSTEIAGAYDSQPAAPPPVVKPAAMRMRTAAPTGNEWLWLQIAGFTVALGVIGVLWWRPWHPRAAAAPAANAAPPDAAASALPTGGQSGPPGADEAVSAGDRVNDRSGLPDAGPPAAADVAPVAGTAMAAAAGGAAVTGSKLPSAALERGDAAAVPGSGHARLRLSFSADSWVTVHDAAGQRVFSGSGRANSVKTMAGAAPLRVYLKSASGVQLEINNHAVAIGPQFVAGDAARFEAGADGVLRRDTHAASATDAVTAVPRPRG
jgi:cytoskeleton protein RodZ